MPSNSPTTATSPLDPTEQTLAPTGVLSFLNTWRPGSQRSRRRRPIRQEATSAASIPLNPKGFFANERTFLSWMQLCLILGGLAMGLLNFGDRAGRVAAVIFGAISVTLAFYALAQFWRRADQLNKRSKGMPYEDMIGALILVAVVFMAVGINFGLRFTGDSKSAP
ncbi:hypothetical protein BC832DRAFT_539268 [Gaertneriomyces semiglobifer]|nr:hypothetical protein BC832DRAFT_539268 [Gaertneriomyces semiglobifer]